MQQLSNGQYFCALCDLLNHAPEKEDIIRLMMGEATINEIRRKMGLPSDLRAEASVSAMSEPYAYAGIIGTELAAEICVHLKNSTVDSVRNFWQKTRNTSERNRQIMLETEGFEDIGYA